MIWKMFLNPKNFLEDILIYAVKKESFCVF